MLANVLMMRLEVAAAPAEPLMLPLGVKICAVFIQHGGVRPLPEREPVRWLIRGSSLGEPGGRWMDGANRLLSIPLAHVNTGVFWSDSCIYLLAGSVPASETPVSNRLRRCGSLGAATLDRNCNRRAAFICSLL